MSHAVSMPITQTAIGGSAVMMFGFARVPIYAGGMDAETRSVSYPHSEHV